MTDLLKLRQKYDKNDLENKIEADKKAVIRQKSKVDIQQDRPIVIPKKSFLGQRNELAKQELDYKIKNDEISQKIRTGQPLIFTPTTANPTEPEENLQDLLNGYRIPDREPFFVQPLLEKELEVESDDSVLNNINLTKQALIDLERQRHTLQNQIDTTTAQKFSAKSQSEMDEIDKELRVNMIRLRDVNNDIRDTETALRNLEGNYNQLHHYRVKNAEIRKNNEQIIKATDNENIQKLKDYEDYVKRINKVNYNLQPLPNETPSEYQERIRRDIELNKQTSQDRFNQQVNDNFVGKLRQLTKSDIITQEISQLITTDDKYIIIQQFNLFKTEFIKIFGEDNKQLTTTVVHKYVENFLSGLERKVLLNKIKSKTPSRSQLNDDDEGEGTLAERAVRMARDRRKRGEENFSEDRSTYIFKNNDGNGNGLYLKVVKYAGKYHLLYSFTGASNTFKEYLQRRLPPTMINSNTEINFETGITTEQIAQRFNVRTISQVADALAGQIQLTTNYTSSEYQNFDEETKLRLGAGIKSENVPKVAQFGSKTILMAKLYHHNTFSLKYKNGVNIKSFTNVKVSDKLRSILINLMQGYKPTITEINTLSKSEQELFDRALYVSNLNKSVENNQDKTVNNLKKRLQIIEGEIEAGNNNPLLKTELKSVLEKLLSFKVVSRKVFTDYLKQYK